MKKYVSAYPTLMKEWHREKNVGLTPETVSYGSKKKIWWQCPKGHVFQATPNSRTASNSGCPFCSGRQVGTDNNLRALYPEIAEEWHPTKNGTLTPDDVTSKSNEKVWWLCKNGHSYFSLVSNRTGNKTGCPYCSGNKVGEDNNLSATYPKIAREWHPTKNKPLLPIDVRHGTARIVWWLCPKGHSYDAKINARTAMNTNCPYCSGRRVGDDNNLLAVFPKLAEEWHPTRNGHLRPEDVTSKSDKNVWWLCPNGHAHKSVIKNRANGSACPKCSNQSSDPEIRILSEFKYIFSDVKSRYKINSIEVDVFVSSMNIAIEYDGKYWHRDKEEADLAKYKALSSENVNLIRVREYPLTALSENDVVLKFDRSLEKTHLNQIVQKAYGFVDTETQKNLQNYLQHNSFLNDALFRKYKSYFPSPFPENSLLQTHPEIAHQWDFEKNHPITPENVSFGSGKAVWWKCQNGHSYSLSPNKRSWGGGCPYCSGRKTLNYDLFD